MTQHRLYVFPLLALYLLLSACVTQATHINGLNKTLDRQLLTLIAWGKYYEVLELLDQGADPNARDYLGRTALMHAALNGQTDTMEILIDRGAKINTKDNANITPLHFAIEFGDPAAVRLLIDKGADVNAKFDFDNGQRDVTPLILAQLRLPQRPEKRISDTLARGRLIYNSIKSDYEQIISMLEVSTAAINKSGKPPYSNNPAANNKTNEMEFVKAQHQRPELYPPAGSPDSGSVCQRKGLLPTWIRFFCSFMTEELWISAERPTFHSKSTNLDWSPFFDLNSGLLEGLMLKDKGEKRYAPWSRFFKEKMNCAGNETINPFVFQSTENLRSDLLGLNWEYLSRDTGDPTNDFEDGAMFVLFTLANFTKTHKENVKVPLNKLLFRLASGETTFRPDYRRDGEVSLVTLDGKATRLDDLDIAARYVKETQYLFTNDLMKTWDEAFQDAKVISVDTKKPLVFIYLAQDIVALPWSNNDIYRKRLKYLVSKAALPPSNSNGFAIVSHGESGPIVASTTMSYPNIKHMAINPTSGPWGKKEFLYALKNTKAKTSLAIGGEDFVTFLGGYTYSKPISGETKECFK